MGDPGSNLWSRRSLGEGNGNPLQCSCLENSMDRGAWQATVHEIADSDMTEWLAHTLLPLITSLIHFSNNYRVLTVSEKAMAPHSSTLAWKIPWTEEPGRLQSMGSQKVRYNWATSLSLFTVMHWRRKWQPTPVFLPGESQGRGSLGAAVHWVTQSRTRLKRLSSSSSSWLCGRHWEYKD